MTDQEKLEMLRKTRTYYERFIHDIDRGESCLIDIYICNEKHGVGNPKGCQAAFRGMIVELDRQIEELTKR